MKTKFLILAAIVAIAWFIGDTPQKECTDGVSVSSSGYYARCSDDVRPIYDPVIENPYDPAIINPYK